MPYVYITIDPTRIEDGNYEVVAGNELRLEHTGGGVSRCKLKEGEDPKAAAAPAATRVCRRARHFLGSDQLPANETGIAMKNKPLVLPLFDLGVPDPLSCDPVHNGRDLQNGLYIAERYLDFSLADIALLFRYSRAPTIFDLAQLGAVLKPNGSTGLIPAAADRLRKLLCEARDVGGGHGK